MGRPLARRGTPGAAEASPTVGAGEGRFRGDVTEGRSPRQPPIMQPQDLAPLAPWCSVPAGTRSTAARTVRWALGGGSRARRESRVRVGWAGRAAGLHPLSCRILAVLRLLWVPCPSRARSRRPASPRSWAVAAAPSDTGQYLRAMGDARQGLHLHPPSSIVAGPPQRQLTGQPGPCCGGCWASGTLVHEGPLWGAWPSPSCCWDPREGCAGSPWLYPCHPRQPGGPSGLAHSAESLTSSVFSVAVSSASTASPPAPCCPGAEESVEETLSAVLASCRLSTGAAIDRRSFIASGLASQLLEELLSQQLPGAEPRPADGPEERCHAATTTSSSLERLRRHDHHFQRAKEHFQEQGWVPAAGPDRDIEVMPCHDQPWENQGRGCWVQPCREACGHLFHGAAWHIAHGCCARVEAVNSACPRDGNRGTVSHPSRKPCGERGHGRGPAGQHPPSYPGTWAPARSELPCARQRPEKC